MKTVFLYGSGLQDPLSHGLRALSKTGGAQFPVRDGWDLDLDVDSVEEGPRDAAPVEGDLFRRAGTGLPGVSEVPARTGVLCADERESGRKREGEARPGDGHHSVLHRLSQALEDVFFEFGEFIQEEDPVVGQAHLTWPGDRPSPDESGVRDGVMGGAERAFRDEGLIWVKEPGHTVDGGRLQGLLECKGREDGGNASCEHGLSRARGADHEDVVTPGGRHLEGAFGVLLSDHILKVTAQGVSDRVSDNGAVGRLDSPQLKKELDDL